MSAYVIANVTVKDPVRYEDYRRLVTPTLAKYGGRFIARGGHRGAGRRLAAEPAGAARISVDGSGARLVELARYTEARLIRQATSEGTLLLLEGV